LKEKEKEIERRNELIFIFLYDPNLCKNRDYTLRKEIRLLDSK